MTMTISFNCIITVAIFSRILPILNCNFLCISCVPCHSVRVPLLSNMGGWGYIYVSEPAHFFFFLFYLQDIIYL